MKNNIFIITTDGMENASRRHGGAEIKAKIKRQTEKNGWDLSSLPRTLMRLKPPRISAFAVNYTHDKEGGEATYTVMCGAITSVRKCKDPDAGEWHESLDKDNERRTK